MASSDPAAVQPAAVGRAEILQNAEHDIAAGAAAHEELLRPRAPVQSPEGNPAYKSATKMLIPFVL
ncbi:MAG TPA: hypothetical protein VG321_07500 [Solirubrobacteraceae bacterium]|nr:hypothetical protein [Solirubrobacteraceae bacterium]